MTVSWLLRILRFIVVGGLYVGTASIAVEIADAQPSFDLGLGMLLGAICAAAYDLLREEAA